MAKPLSGSTAPSLGTRSRTWPYEARTVKSLPRYLLIVLALAGDSTMRRFLAMGESGSGRSPGATGRTPNDSREGNARGGSHGRWKCFSFLVESRGGQRCQAEAAKIGARHRPRGPLAAPTAVQRPAAAAAIMPIAAIMAIRPAAIRMPPI